jgi:hypothetical protein
MTIKVIYEKVKELKQFIINMVKEVVEQSSWNEFEASLDSYKPGIYRILEDDLPIMRDLKAFLNMLTAIESMTEKMTIKYALFGAAIGNRIMIIDDVFVFNENYKIYRSTNSIVTHYLSYLKDLSLIVVLPKIVEKMEELHRLCTVENLDKVSDFFIEQVITLEQYQDNYLQKKRLGNPQEQKEEQDSDFITTIIEKNDQYLRKIYKEEYNTHFVREVKVDEMKNQVIEYYQENKTDTDIIKNLKQLSNGIIGVKKLIDEHDAYKQSGIYSVFYYAPSLISHLRKVYSSLSEFDYQAIIAEKSTPFTKEIKQQLSTLNGALELLACVADQFELELRLKEGTLLKIIDLIINRHNQIMCELRIPTDYLKQKHTYYISRLSSRQVTISDIEGQIQKLRQFMGYKNHALIDIPFVVNNAIQEYIKKYNDDICMDRNHLKKYQKYLVDAVDVKRGLKSFIMSQFESVANYYGRTLHAELLSALDSRLQYLEKQRLFILEKNKQIVEYHVFNPYDNVKPTQISELGQQAVILKLLKNRSQELESEKKELLPKVEMKKNIKTETKDAIIALDDIDKDKTKPKIYYKIERRYQELNFFSRAIKTYEIDQTIPTPETIVKEVGISPKSFLLLHELNEVNKLPEKKMLSA